MNEIKDIFKWHDWFAWLPVEINGKFVWFKTIQRQAVWLYPSDRAYEAKQSWEYRLK